MNNKLLIAGVIATTALLGGCSTNVELGNSVAALTNQVNDLSMEVDDLSMEVDELKAGQKMMDTDMTSTKALTAAEAAASEAERANARIDNIVESYKK